MQSKLRIRIKTITKLTHRDEAILAGNRETFEVENLFVARLGAVGVEQKFKPGKRNSGTVEIMPRSSGKRTFNANISFHKNVEIPL